MTIEEILNRGIAMCEGRKAVGDYITYDDQNRPCLCIQGALYAGVTGKLPISQFDMRTGFNPVTEAICDALDEDAAHYIRFEGRFVHRNDDPDTEKTLRELADEMIAELGAL